MQPPGDSLWNSGRGGHKYVESQKLACYLRPINYKICNFEANINYKICNSFVLKWVVGEFFRPEYVYNHAIGGCIMESRILKMSSKSKKQNIESAGVGHEWIKTRLREVGKQVKDLAEALDQPPPRISEKIKGKLEFQADDIPVIAKVLELPINEVLAKLPFQGKGLLPEGFTLVEVQGAAKAGEWMKAVQLKEKNWGYVLVPKEAEYPYVSALRVTGDDMEKFYAPDQSVVLFSPYEQYKKKIHDADHVIVERSDGNGQKEITVKELKIEDDGRVWLVPHSKNPQYKPIEISKLDSVKTYYGNDMLKITGVVVKVITDYKPQRSSKNISLPKSL